MQLAANQERRIAIPARDSASASHEHTMPFLDRQLSPFSCCTSTRRHPWQQHRQHRRRRLSYPHGATQPFSACHHPIIPTWPEIRWRTEL